MKRKLGVVLLVVALALALGVVPAASVGADPDPGIVGIWHLDNNANDSSGNGNNGTVTGATYVSDQWGGQALDFNGTSDYVGIPDPNGTANLDGFSELTLEAWIYPDSVSGTQAIISKYDSRVGFGVSYYLSLVGDEVQFYVRQNSSNRAYKTTDSADLTTGSWYHVAGSWDGSTLKICVDGVEKLGTTTGTVPTSMWDTSVPVELGAFHSSSGTSVGRFSFFDGKIDEVRIWDTATPVLNLYVEPEEDINPVDTDHTVSAYVKIDKVGDDGTEPAPGVKVNFEVSGKNDDSGIRYTNSTGVANVVLGDANEPFTYTGDGGAGMDTITVSIDQDCYQYVDVDVEKYWLVSFVTGGGKLSVNTATGSGSAKKPGYTFGGTVGYLPDMSLVGQFQIVDHMNKESWHCHDNFSELIFGLSTEAPAESPYAYYDKAQFIGEYTSNKGNTATIKVRIQDRGEPGKGVDIVLIDTVGRDTVNVTTNGPKLLDGGNFQVHEGFKD